MRARYFGFLLLVLFPGVIHAQGTAQFCAPPVLNGGFFVPEQNMYPHDTTLTYACDTGRKPAVEGWWATSRCQNGKWYHEPQCIYESSCLPPTIPDGKYRETQNGWYEENHIITVACHKGYELRNSRETAHCINGTWSSLPVCEKRTDTCGVPPQIPHAVIIHQGPQDVFASDSELQYECENGYVKDRADTKKSIICRSGNWIGAPSCIDLILNVLSKGLISRTALYLMVKYGLLECCDG
ncbi:complement factor H-related protein 1-like [Odontesthes bonariensis]|uniref:complement factor H-related protein 1-like n=1 Tax=Odontesthes bonariensis TaxID=219752 RepID=UPI003F584537